jgi:tetratricopeptide (TPR) repeat protein
MLGMTSRWGVGRPRLVAFGVAAVLFAACATALPSASTSPAASTAPVARVLPSSAMSPPSPASSPAPTPTASPAASSPTVAEVARLEARIAETPDDADAQRALGFALAQRVRETADPSLYAPALDAFHAALRIDPTDAEALVGVAGIQLGRHEFADALVTTRSALAIAPGLVAAHAAEVDALVELGRYDQADEAAGEMLGLRADLSTLARVSYLAELRGHLPAALIAMRRAAASPGLAPENTAYVDALLGNLLAATGDRTGAANAYGRALGLVTDHAPSLAGQGRLAVAEGRLDDAIALFQRAAAVVPLPEYVIALGDAQSADGRAADAARSYELARAEIRLFQAAGVSVDVDLALLEADHGDPADALRHARAAYVATPTVRAADAVAWALHRLGRDRAAAPWVAKALRLGTVDPILRFHAGAIEAGLRERAVARRDLTRALAVDAGFSATGAAEARRLLATLGD